MVNSQVSDILIPNCFLCRMLDDMGNEMDCTETKLDATMKKVAKVLHISNGEFH